MRILSGFLFFIWAAPVFAQGSCFASFDVDADRTIAAVTLDAIVGDLAGRTCHKPGYRT